MLPCKHMDYLFLLGRILYGGFFLMSGINHFTGLNGMSEYAKSKGVPMPKLAVGASGLLIILGGLWIILGALVRVGLYEIILFLVPVTFMMHRFWEEKDPMAKMMQQTNFMKNLALLGAAIMMLMLPAVWPLALNW